MDKRTVIGIINNFKGHIVQKGIKIDKIILYGSHANNTQKPESDIDIILISDSFKDMSYWQRIEIIADVISEIFQPIEAICMTNDEWNNKIFKAAVYAKDGISV